MTETTNAEFGKPEDDPLTSRGERLSELRRRAHADWEPWIQEAEETPDKLLFVRTSAGDNLGNIVSLIC